MNLLMQQGWKKQLEIVLIQCIAADTVGSTLGIGLQANKLKNLLKVIKLQQKAYIV